MARFFISLSVLDCNHDGGTDFCSPCPQRARVPSSSSLGVTFNKDVLPILQKNCQVCHRPGEAAPMSLPDIRKHASLGEGDQAGGCHAEDASVVRRSGSLAASATIRR